MPISSMTLARTPRFYTQHMKNFELGTITETNPSNGVYRYTFTNGTSPNSWDEVMSMIGGISSSGAYGRCGIYVGYLQQANLDGANSYYDGTTSMIWIASKQDSVKFNISGNTVDALPSGRATETTANFANFLGSTTYNPNRFIREWNPRSTRMQNNSPVTVSYTAGQRYVEINWNQIALNETTYTTYQRVYGRTVAGNVKLVFQPYMIFDDMQPNTEQFYYFGKPRFYNTSITGNNLATLASSPPAAVTNFSYPGGRVFEWTEPTSNAASAYIYLYKWNGSAWAEVRNGYISDGQITYANDISTTPTTWNRYTVPVGDGSGYYYIVVYQYDGYNGTFGGGAASNFISV